MATTASIAIDNHGLLVTNNIVGKGNLKLQSTPLNNGSSISEVNAQPAQDRIANNARLALEDENFVAITAPRRGKRTRYTGDENEERSIPAPLLSKSPANTSNNLDEEWKEIGRAILKARKTANRLMHKKMIHNRRTMETLRVTLKEKDQLLKQFKVMWMEEKAKNQQLWNRLHVFEAELHSMARPLKLAIHLHDIPKEIPAHDQAKFL
uniref:Uncharacterized protein n=1 Tax=Spongospora subterranea TaxID=70186 RepID=A0A0H5RA14_9EUKA|eukprot:CRZ10517.1 hypothetical protein [Spongospora subterranea]